MGVYGIAGVTGRPQDMVAYFNYEEAQEDATVDKATSAFWPECIATLIRSSRRPVLKLLQTENQLRHVVHNTSMSYALDPKLSSRCTS